MPAEDRVRLEQLCRYLLGPPVAQDRLRLTGDGHVLLELKTAWADGTSHLLFEFWNRAILARGRRTSQGSPGALEWSANRSLGFGVEVAYPTLRKN